MLLYLWWCAFISCVFFGWLGALLQDVAEPNCELCMRFHFKMTNACSKWKMFNYQTENKTVVAVVRCRSSVEVCKKVSYKYFRFVWCALKIDLSYKMVLHCIITHLQVVFPPFVFIWSFNFEYQTTSNHIFSYQYSQCWCLCCWCNLKNFSMLRFNNLNSKIDSKSWIFHIKLLCSSLLSLSLSRFSLRSLDCLVHF